MTLWSLVSRRTTLVACRYRSSTMGGGRQMSSVADRDNILPVSSFLCVNNTCKTNNMQVL